MNDISIEEYIDNLEFNKTIRLIIYSNERNMDEIGYINIMKKEYHNRIALGDQFCLKYVIDIFDYSHFNYNLVDTLGNPKMVAYRDHRKKFEESAGHKFLDVLKRNLYDIKYDIIYNPEDYNNIIKKSRYYDKISAAIFNNKNIYYEILNEDNDSYRELCFNYKYGSDQIK